MPALPVHLCSCRGRNLHELAVSGMACQGVCAVVVAEPWLSLQYLGWHAGQHLCPAAVLGMSVHNETAVNPYLCIT